MFFPNLQKLSLLLVKFHVTYKHVVVSGLLPWRPRVPGIPKNFKQFFPMKNIVCCFSIRSIRLTCRLLWTIFSKCGAQQSMALFCSSLHIIYLPPPWLSARRILRERSQLAVYIEWIGVFANCMLQHFRTSSRPTISLCNRNQLVFPTKEEIMSGSNLFFF